MAQGGVVDARRDRLGGCRVLGPDLDPALSPAELGPCHEEVSRQDPHRLGVQTGAEMGADPLDPVVVALEPLLGLLHEVDHLRLVEEGEGGDGGGLGPVAGRNPQHASLRRAADMGDEQDAEVPEPRSQEVEQGDGVVVAGDDDDVARRIGQAPEGIEDE